MKKYIALAAAAVGFLFGSRAGRRPYEQFDANVRKVLGRKGAQGTFDSPSVARPSWADVPDGNGSDE
jgi:hypothetical protein